MINGLVGVKVKSFTQLQKAKYPFSLDNYQRPYVWGEIKIRQLIDDLLTYQQQDGSKPNYYMGTLLVHHNKEHDECFVIDGQQRLTSLSVLYYVLNNGVLPKNIDFHYRSVISARNIQKARKLFQTHANAHLNKNIFSFLEFTVITVDREDLAFTFFDTQNNRGVPLKATDLLKAFHLRAIQSDNQYLDNQFQELCAKRWEHVQIQGERGIKNKANDFAPELFHRYLWRARQWRGKAVNYENHDAVLDTFQAQSVKVNNVTKVPLYHGSSNRFASSISLLANDDYRLAPQEVEISHHAAWLPFSIRQPIHQGVGFFLYAQKYVSLLNMLLHDSNPTPEVAAFRRFYNSVIGNLSLYLQELYKLATLLYVDQFGCDQLLRFALYLDHVLGAIRLEKAYIFKEAPLKFLKEPSQNLLDVIAGAYRPEEVIDYLSAYEPANAVYVGKIVTEVVVGEGVRGRYLDALLKYYGKSSLDNKKDWMETHINAEVIDG
jgi:hypothetical protein